MKKRLLQFSVLALLLVVACAIPISVADAATGSLSASSRYICVPSGLGSVTISWSTSGCSTAQVYVCRNNCQDQLWAQNPSGSGTATWIDAGSSFTFKLYADTARTELLDMVTVVAYGTSSGAIGTEETEVIIPAGQTLGSVELTWGTNGYSTAQVYVKMDGGSETLMTQSPYGTTTPTWIQAEHKYEFKLYAGTGHTTLLDSVTLYGRKYAYEGGPNHNATTSDFQADCFITQYHLGTYRATTLSQLQQMANLGATRLQLGLYVYGKQYPDAGYPTPWPALITSTNFWLHFPPTTQELNNIRQYAQDVASIQASDGHRLFLDIEFYWGAASDYMIGSPTGQMGYYNIAAATFKSYIQTTYQNVIMKIYNVYRPDGKKVVSSVSFGNEIGFHKTNTDWLLYTSGLYQTFTGYCGQRGIAPALELHMTETDAANIMSTTLQDGTYPLLDGHRSMYYPYRTLKFLKDNGLLVPDRINFSMYPEKGGYTYSQIVTKIFDDADAVLPSLGIRKYYGVTEAEYFDPTTQAGSLLRAELGAAIAQERLRNNRVSLIEFWTNPSPVLDWQAGTYKYPHPAAPYQAGIAAYLP